eukprot:2855370-Alexandrium_andersonii.AAC.1
MPWSLEARLGEAVDGVADAALHEAALGERAHGRARRSTGSWSQRGKKRPGPVAGAHEEVDEAMDAGLPEA